LPIPDEEEADMRRRTMVGAGLVAAGVLVWMVAALPFA